MEKIKILLVDDDKDLLDALAVLLQSQNYETITAHSGKQGIQFAREIKPDLIILDVQMETRFSGFEFQIELLADENLKHIPVLMNTGIEVMVTNESVVDIIREMRKDPDFKDRSVLLVKDYKGVAAIDYLTEKNKSQFFYVDGFLAKPVEPAHFFSEIKRILDKK